MVSDIFNELLFIAKIDADFTINNYQIINEAIVELEGDTSKTNDALNSLSPLVATKVLETMTENEIRALASLPPGVFDVIYTKWSVMVTRGYSSNEDAEHTIGCSETRRPTLNQNMVYVPGKNLKVRPLLHSPIWCEKV